ncbi:hypothetical protein AGOR_G00217630 [Albula goreensis]|uniref:Ig-like domain-containing protein n=1 Tax=Albula goreensis TaxID=1534307 RepID=A0A8T3CMZ1_9TELE|nr:hypothetical protein AGOR_G00217630 [Albula goreensis]
MVSRKMWQITLMWFAVLRCEGIEVTVGDERKYARLFEEVVLPCHYSSTSSQTAVVQWWYKSYCRDRTRDSFSFPETLLYQRSEFPGSSHLDCSDSARTVRIIASIRGSSTTVAEYYREREDIDIINQFDLRIGHLQWGDSGVYQCKVVISDDPEGKNEAQVELLVLGKIGALDDLLPGFDVEVMPDWVFVGLIIVGGCFFLLVVGICWCQCCPHSCFCYLPCCCCRRSCCCPQHLYEAGKVVRSQPIFISGVPTMFPIVPPSLIQPNMASPLPLENIVVGASSLPELRSVPDRDSDSQRSCPPIQKKAFPPTGMSSSQELRSPTPPQRSNQAEEQISRWNPRSEHLQRKALHGGGGRGMGQSRRTGSLDELEEFALLCGRRGRRAFALELRESEEDSAPPSTQKRHNSTSPQHDDTFLGSTPPGREGRSQGDGRGEGDTHSKTSSGTSSDCYLSISPINQHKDGIPLLPYCEVERHGITRTPKNPTRTPKERKAEPKKHRKTNGLLKRDSLKV